MATWDDVRRLAMALPETAEGTSRDGLPGWSVKGKSFAWERPL
ncbi:MAG TPA: MmcQ/YjbR family DNA-binding protein, partial [Actinomycetota bacterium]